MQKIINLLHLICLCLICACTQQFHLTQTCSKGTAKVISESIAERKSAIAPSTPIAVTQGTANVNAKSGANLEE